MEQSFILVVHSLGSEATGMAFLVPTVSSGSPVAIQIMILVSLIRTFSTQMHLTFSPGPLLPALLPVKVLLRQLPPRALLPCPRALHLCRPTRPSLRPRLSRRPARRGSHLALRLLRHPPLPLWQETKAARRRHPELATAHDVSAISCEDWHSRTVSINSYGSLLPPATSLLPVPCATAQEQKPLV